MTDETKALERHLYGEMSRWAMVYRDRANERHRALEMAKQEEAEAAACGFPPYPDAVRRAEHALKVARREYEAFMEAVLGKPKLNDSKGAIDAWRLLAQGQIPPAAPTKRGRPKDLEVTLRKQAAKGIIEWLDVADTPPEVVRYRSRSRGIIEWRYDPTEQPLWLAWLGVLRLWRTLNPGVPEPFIPDQTGWLKEAEEEYRVARQADPQRTGTRKGEQICQLLLRRLDAESRKKHLGP